MPFLSLYTLSGAEPNRLWAMAAMISRALSPSSSRGDLWFITAGMIHYVCHCDCSTRSPLILCLSQTAAGWYLYPNPLTCFCLRPSPHGRNLANLRSGRTEWWLSACCSTSTLTVFPRIFPLREKMGLSLIQPGWLRCDLIFPLEIRLEKDLVNWETYTSAAYTGMVNL